jgi:hypothetical protein
MVKPLRSDSVESLREVAVALKIVAIPGLLTEPSLAVCLSRCCGVRGVVRVVVLVWKPGGSVVGVWRSARGSGGEEEWCVCVRGTDVGLCHHDTKQSLKKI